MLEYAVKLTRTPGEMTAGDVEVVRSHGFDDRGVLDICQVVSYYNYVNRLADGVGVELEAYWRPEDLIVSQAEMAQARKGEDR
ncbi:MAG: peroxidase [Gemmatimonadetes bacterium]|nr:peroxidase [Gemmatimonadota bacterium]